MTVAAFRALHHDRRSDDPVVLPGPWDVRSAQVLEAEGFAALATPSAGICASFGYPDHGLPAEEMFAAITRIARAVEVPVSADVEDGYGLAPGELVARILDTGAVGCNLEDSVHGVLKDPHRHADWLAEVRQAAGDELFVNARIDTFILGDTDVTAGLERARLYTEAGADCVYPIMAPTDALETLRAELKCPINAACHPEPSAVRKLAEIGVTRITFGPLLQQAAMSAVKAAAEQLRPGRP